MKMADVTVEGTVEKIGEEGNVGASARELNRQAWRANVSSGDDVGGDVGGATDEAKKKLEELEEGMAGESKSP